MLSKNFRRLAFAAGLTCSLNVACSDPAEEGNQGTNPSTTTGGGSSTDPTGGASASGGATNTGGSAATGGSTATGGSVATGDGVATGGTPNTGGAPTSGGSPSTGGDASGGEPPLQTGGNAAGGSAAGGSETGGSGGMAVIDDSPIEELDWDKPTATVSSLVELQAAILNSDQHIVLAAGNYSWTELPENNRILTFSGSNNTIDLVGAYIEVPVGIIRESYLVMPGSGNSIIGGEVEDFYTTGLEEVTDYYAYNNDRDNHAVGLGGDAVFSVTGSDNTIDHLKLTVRGSFPYGYGSIYGIGSGNAFGLNKRCGIVIKGQDNTISNTEVQQQAFCHGIYMQAPADRTTIINTLVEGVMRPSIDLYDETEPDSLPATLNFMLPNPDDMRDHENPSDDPIPRDVMLPLSEDGIRAYNGSGSVTVENCVVKKMRGGIRLYLASDATVSDSKAVDCGATNYNMPAGGTVTNSSGNFAYAPLSDFRLSRSRQNLEITILPSPHAVGPHNLADVLGGSHQIVFHRTPGPIDTVLKPIIVSGNSSTIVNETEYPIIVSGDNNTISSAGDVTDDGSGNDISELPLEL